MTAIPPYRRDSSPLQPAAAGHDTWFVWRNLLALWISLTYAVKVLLMHESTLANFAPPADQASSLGTYVAARGLFALFACGLYMFSYLRDWHFRAVAWIFVAVPIGGLMLDWLRVYMFALPAPAAAVPGLIGLRLLAIACLLLNAINAHRAPPMPRALWR